MTKILNLDKLSKNNGREITISGKTYPVQPMTVENFIETSRVIEKMTANGSTMADQISATVDVICRCVPTMPREMLMNYDVARLDTIATFVRGENVDEQDATEGEGAGKQ